MEGARGRSKPAALNRRGGSIRRLVRGNARTHGVVERRTTRSSAKLTKTSKDPRMDLNANLFPNYNGTPGHMEAQQPAFQVPPAVMGNNQVMQRTFNTATPPFQGHFSEMNMTFHPMMQQQQGHFQVPYTAPPSRFAMEHNGPAEPTQQHLGRPHEVQQQHERLQEVQQVNNEDNDVEEVPASNVPQPAGKKKGQCIRGPGYQPEEDRVLCSGWLNISKDATVGTNQDKTGFYKRLHQYYKENYDMNTKRSVNSIQQRWSTIQTRVSKFSAILSRIERMNQSGKSYQDMVNDAIKCFQETEPWHYHHCWEMLRDEPKWNDKLLEIHQVANKGKAKQDESPTDTPTQSDHEGSSMPSRPEGRDAAKRRRASKLGENTSSSVAVDMLKKMHDRGQEMDEHDARHKEELMVLERTKVDIQQKQLQAQYDMVREANQLKKEISAEKMKLQREMTEAQLKVQVQALDVERQKNDTHIMFTDVSNMRAGLRAWVLQRQTEIMIRDGVDPELAKSID